MEVMKDYFIIDINGEQQGPYDEDGLRADMEQGLFSPDTMAWTEGMTSWKPLSAIFCGVPGLAAPPPPPSPRQRGNVLILSTDDVLGCQKGESLGLVSASVVMSKNAITEAVAGFKSVFGGELPQFTKLMDETRDLAIQRVRKKARAMRADAVCGLRLTSSEIMTGVCEVCAYGTAVKFLDD